MDVPESQRETVAMLQLLAGGAAPVETHASLVFVGADTVWKLKKAVRLPFLDFTDALDRRRFTERELALNSVAAKDLYRDVVPVVRRADRTLELGGEASRAIDWVVRMARVPSADFLDARAKDGRIGPVELDAMADVVAAYHAALSPVQGVVPPMREFVEGNYLSALDSGLDANAASRWRASMLQTLDQLASWTAERAETGFVRRGHGDLHLGNMCMWHGDPVPFDALEFDETLATIDLGYDIAFLLMDLERRMGRAAANRVLNRYIARNGDVGLLRGLPVFLSMRAMIRSHVEARMGRSDAAAGYLTFALAYMTTAQPTMVAIGGLPGTGKSTLARAIAPMLGASPGAVILRSDEIRKRRFGVAPEQRLPLEAYRTEVSEAVLTDLIRDAGRAASAGQAVIADATFLDPLHRERLARTAAAAGVSLQGFWLDAPLSLLEERIAGRRNDASDATVQVLRTAAARYDRPSTWEQVDVSDLQAATASLRHRLSLPDVEARAPVRTASGEAEP